MSACSSCNISSACCAVVINPTAPVNMFASLLICSAKGTWYKGLTGIFCADELPPEEQSIKSISFSFNSFASCTESSTDHPPSTHSTDDILTNNGNASENTDRTASATS